MKQWFWPDIDDMDSAKKAAHTGAGAAFFITLVTGTLTFLETQGYFKLLGLGPEAYIDAGLFLIIGLGIYFMSRIAALAGLGLYGFEQVVMIKSGGGRFSLMTIYLVLAFVNSIRATFAYHQIKKDQPKDTGPAGPVSILTGQPANAESATAPAEETPKRSLKTPILIGVVLLIALGVGAWFFLKRPQPPFPSKPLLTLPAIPMPKKIAETIATTGGKTFHLVSGEVIRGEVMMEDPDFFVVRHDGKEDVLERKNITSVE